MSCIEREDHDLKESKFNKLKGPLMYLLLLGAILLIVNLIGKTPTDKIDNLSYSQVLTLVQEDGVSDVMTTGTTLILRYKGSSIPQSEFGTRYDAVATLDSVSRF